MSTATQLTQLLNLIPYLHQNPGAPLDQVASFVRTTPQELTENLHRILMCGVPPFMPDDYIGVYFEGDRVTVRFADHFKRPLSITLQELLSLLLLLETCQDAVGIEHATEKAYVASLRHKLLNLLEPEHRKSVDAINQRLNTRTSRSASLSGTLITIRHALAQRHKLVMVYYSQSKTDPTERCVHPYALIDQMGQWYMAAHCERRNGRRLFRIDRIKSIELLGESSFEVPADFNADHYKTDRLFTGPTRYTLRVRFDAACAAKISERYPQQVAGKESDGRLLVELEADSIEWTTPWLLKYGDQAEAITPPDVRQRMVKTLNAILLKYGESG